MSTAANFFSEIQQAVVNILDPEAVFDNVPLLPETLGDLQSVVETVMAKMGVCVTIETPFASIVHADLPPVYFENIPVVVTIWEDTTLNRPTGDVNQVHFMEMALSALYLLTHSTPKNAEGVQIATQFTADNPTLVDCRKNGRIDAETFPNLQGVQINLVTTCGFTYTPQATILDGNNQALLDGMGIKLTADRPFSRT